MSNLKSPKKRRAWPAKRRAAQAKNCRKTKPWKHTTGPRTDEGKERIKHNAMKHGHRRAAMRRINTLLAKHNRFIKGLLSLKKTPSA